MAKSRRADMSIAEARNGLAALVHEAEDGRPVRITRRGRPVAVLISLAEYERLASQQPGAWQAIRDFRDLVVRERIELDDSDFEGLRDPSPGRRVNLS